MEHVPPHSLEGLSAQGSFDPVVANASALTGSERILICGMGGSRLAGELIRSLVSNIDVTIHASYGLPRIHDKTLKKTHVIISSFSGNTAEALDAYRAARGKGVLPSVITSGGTLLELAKREGSPYVELPNIGLPPRETIVHSLLAHLALVGKTEDIRHIKHEIELLVSTPIEAEAERLVTFLGSKTPLLYAPTELEGLLRIYKINFNETSRRPCFFTLIPEVNHGEVEMFDGNEMTYTLTRDFAVVLFNVEGLDLRLSARTKLLSDVLTARGVSVRTLQLEDWSWKSLLSAIGISLRASAIFAHRTDLTKAPPTLINEFKEKMKPFDTTA